MDQETPQIAARPECIIYSEPNHIEPMFNELFYSSDDDLEPLVAKPTATYTKIKMDYKPYGYVQRYVQSMKLHLMKINMYMFFLWAAASIFTVYVWNGPIAAIGIFLGFFANVITFSLICCIRDLEDFKEDIIHKHVCLCSLCIACNVPLVEYYRFLSDSFDSTEESTEDIQRADVCILEDRFVYGDFRGDVMYQLHKVVRF